MNEEKEVEKARKHGSAWAIFYTMYLRRSMGVVIGFDEFKRKTEELWELLEKKRKDKRTERRIGKLLKQTA
jgi:hypothetical protein